MPLPPIPVTGFRTIRAKIVSRRFLFIIGGVIIIGLVIIYLVGYSKIFSAESKWSISDSVGTTTKKKLPPPIPPLDKVAYDLKLYKIANATSSAPIMATSSASTTHTLWPVKTAYPNGGAILPFNRIVAYYGNFLSKGMGVLGEYPAEEMLAKLKVEVNNWQVADPDTPVIPAIHYIAVTAQESAGTAGLYRLRMPDDQIKHALDLAREVNGIVFLDVQVGLGNLKKEVEALEPYLKLSQVHLAIDPEFSMKTGDRPGTVIGTVDALDINTVAEYLAQLVRDNNLPPKILIVHRFTLPMITNYEQIVPLPEVQIVIDMDGWGSPAKKFGTYNSVIYPEPVQFTGFKLFYKNDLRPPSERILTPAEILKLKPQPVYIQYQ